MSPRSPFDMLGKPDPPMAPEKNRWGWSLHFESYLGFSHIGNSAESQSYHPSDWVLKVVVDRSVGHAVIQQSGDRVDFVEMWDSGADVGSSLWVTPCPLIPPKTNLDCYNPQDEMPTLLMSEVH